MAREWTSRWNLRFDDPAVEREFHTYHELTSVPIVRDGMLGALICWACLHAGVAVFAPRHLLLTTLLLGALYPVMLSLFLLGRRPPTPDRGRLIQRLCMVSHGIAFAIAIGMAQLHMGADLLALSGVVALLYNVASVYRHRSGQVLSLVSVAGGAYLGALGYLHLQGRLEPELRWIGPVLVGSTVLMGYLVARSGERVLREAFLKDRVIASQQVQIREEKARSEALLLNVLPEPIAMLLRDRPGVIAEEQVEASVLFADLAGFTALSSGMSAGAVVEMLNEVFTEFDLLVEKHGLEKIKTIGDCYMVASGVPRPRPDHAVVLVRLALEMRDLVASRRFGGHALSFRFGVNSGPVVAGVIGRRKFIYDLWGDTVNVASRMETCGHAGAVQVTDATRERVSGAFVCEPRGRVDVKGKGEMPVYHVIGPCPPD